MIKLFYAPGTCALAPHIVLEWIGEPYDLQKVKQSDPEYLKLNPLGQVPAMIDGESGVMNQASAILKYLARKYPEAKLGDDGTLQDGYDLDRWMAFLTGDVHPAFFPFFMTARYSTDSSDLTKQSIKEASYKLIAANAARGQYSFEGNVEGRDIGAGTVDVVVCDGFVGNVVLKVAEGLAKMFGGELRRALTSDWRAKIGALILKPALLRFKKRLDYTEFGGAALLGVNGVCIICHGSSDERSIYSAIRMAQQIVETDVVGSIRKAMEDSSVAQLVGDENSVSENLATESIVTAPADLNGTPLVTTDSGQPVVPPVNF